MDNKNCLKILKNSCLNIYLTDFTFALETSTGQ